ncbi:MAG: hypothetical protein KJ709_01540, partial [Nanoarchaeota archaeon]|nr:hypothetical protein [Nanoarchaeota archaeon]
MKSIDQVIHAQGVGADQDMTALEYLIADEETRSHVIDYFRGTQKVLSLWVAAPIVKQVEDEFSISDDDGVIVKRGSENIIHKLVPEQLRRKIIGRNGSQVVEFQKLYSCPNAWDLEDQHIETIRNDHFFLKCYVKDGKFIMVSMSNRPAYSIGQRDHQKFEISISAVDLKNNSNRFAVHVDEITRDPKRPDYGHMILNYYFNERLQDGGRLGKKTQFFIDVEHSRLMPFGQGFIDLLERTDYRKAPHFRDVKSVFLTGQPEVRLEDSIEAFIYNLARHPSADRVFSAYEGKDAHLYFESGNGLWKGSRIVAYHYTPKRPDFVQAQARIFSPLRFCM